MNLSWDYLIGRKVITFKTNVFLESQSGKNNTYCISHFVSFRYSDRWEPTYWAPRSCEQYELRQSPTRAGRSAQTGEEEQRWHILQFLQRDVCRGRYCGARAIYDGWNWAFKCVCNAGITTGVGWQFDRAVRPKFFGLRIFLIEHRTRRRETW